MLNAPGRQRRGRHFDAVAPDKPWEGEQGSVEMCRCECAGPRQNHWKQ